MVYRRGRRGIRGRRVVRRMVRRAVVPNKRSRSSSPVYSPASPVYSPASPQAGGMSDDSAHKEEPEVPKMSPEEKELQEMGADAFFIGKCATVNEKTALRAIDIVSPYRGAVWAPDHSDLPVFAPYLLAPVVSYCPICGESFVAPDDLALLKTVPTKAEADKSEPAKAALKRVRDARTAHFQKVYKTEGDSVYPTRTSTHMPTHRVVREVLSRPQYANLDMPTRDMVRDVLLLVDSLRPDSRGFVFRRDLVEHIVAAAWNFIQQRKAGAKVIGNLHVTVEERVLMEVGMGLVPHVDLATTEGIPPDVLADLLKPYLFRREEEEQAVKEARENAHGQGKVKEALESAEKARADAAAGAAGGVVYMGGGYDSGSDMDDDDYSDDDGGDDQMNDGGEAGQDIQKP